VRPGVAPLFMSTYTLSRGSCGELRVPGPVPLQEPISVEVIDGFRVQTLFSLHGCKASVRQIVDNDTTQQFQLEVAGAEFEASSSTTLDGEAEATIVDAQGDHCHAIYDAHLERVRRR
ncbi:MAG TPA: hypothetical protein VK509_01370, partial [Polyangiales bacterium]|nr:hypothetical protein [Polyangiales bacterium]